MEKKNFWNSIFFLSLLFASGAAKQCVMFHIHSHASNSLLSNIWNICYKWRWSENINKRTCKTMKLLQYTFRVNWAVALYCYVTTASESPTNMKINTLFMWTCFVIKWARGRIVKKNKMFSLYRGPFWHSEFTSHDLRCR